MAEQSSFAVQPFIFKLNLTEPRSTHLQQNNLASKNHTELTTCQSLINEIIKCAGYSMARIAAETNIPLITMRRLRSGMTKVPRSAAFHKIFTLYCKVCLCKQEGYS